MGPEPDEQLMERVAEGCRESLERLVRRYSNSLLTYLQRMTGNAHTGEELFQEVFLAVWTRRHTYRASRPFRSWLFAIATNQGRARFRRAAARVPVLEAVCEPAVVAPSPLDQAESSEAALLVAEAVTRLPIRQRSVVVLRVWNGLAYGEIARLLGCGEATVRSHMHHGLAALRRQLEPKLNRTAS